MASRDTLTAVDWADEESGAVVLGFMDGCESMVDAGAIITLIWLAGQIWMAHVVNGVVSGIAVLEYLFCPDTFRISVLLGKVAWRLCLSHEMKQRTNIERIHNHG